MRTLSRAAVLAVVFLMFSAGLLVQGQTPVYPVVVTTGDGTVFIAAHTSSLEEGNWIELSGGSTVTLPSLTLAYEGPDSVKYSPISGVTVTIESLFSEGSTAYPLDTHQVYTSSQPIDATFWGASTLAGEEVYFKLIRTDSMWEIRDIAVDAYNGDLYPLRCKLGDPEWESMAETLDSYGDWSITIPPPQSVGNYVLVVVKEDGSDIYVYSATIVEVVKQTLDITCPSSVEKGDKLYVDTGAAAGQGIVAILIKESAYTADIKLLSDGTVISTELYLNDFKMADGALVKATESLSYEDLISLGLQLINAFGTNQMAVGLGSGSVYIPTRSLIPGEYVLLVGMIDSSQHIVGVYQKAVTVRPKYHPPVWPINKAPKANAGPNMKIPVGGILYLSGADSYDPDGTITGYSWDFGDGTTATGEIVSHTYTKPGHYTVTLTVKDNRGAEDSDKCMVMVWEWPAPVADKFGMLVPGEQKGFKVDALEEANTVVTLDTMKHRPQVRGEPPPRRPDAPESPPTLRRRRGQRH
ncbi:MAG: TIGR04279 domain-containing protein [Promethearchaeota archaeon]